MDTTQTTIEAPANHRIGYPEIIEGLKVRRIVPNADGISPVVTLGKILPGGKLSGPWTVIVEEEPELNPKHLRAVIHIKDLWDQFVPAPKITEGLKLRQVIDGKIQDEILTVGAALYPEDEPGWALIGEWEEDRIRNHRYGVTPVFFSNFWDNFVPAYPPVVEGMQVQIRLDGDRIGGAIWTVGEVSGDWTSIVEWEQVASTQAATGIGRRIGAHTPIFVPKLWDQFVPAEIHGA